ncbi:MAG TPA: LamG domain-containing protein [Candidatus Pacearchaeota archaeon]|nr:LamG domain-containing protein [Candidatus Parcubacteria bacterium]HOC53433.1 LamG domain-containing protein [Candidatus Pacearchaeota archaeon]HQM24319.1 LamG domain-containing protein [Candidatus Pacearchaeota archaeon]
MNKSFTLIEILVVIVVIGILSAFILVGVSSISNNANITKSKAFSDSLRNSLLTSLISEWKLDNNTNDSWGTNNGTWNGSGGGSYTSPSWREYSECVSEECIAFDGTDDYISFGGLVNSNITNFMTVNFWIKDSNLSNNGIMGKWDWDGGDYRSWAISFQGNNFMEIIVSDDGTWNNWKKISKTLTPSNTWINMVFVFNSGDMKFFMNGKEESVAPTLTGTVTKIYSNNGAFEIGRAYYIKSFDGIMDDVNIYNQVTSLSQIQANYYIGVNKLFKNKGLSKIEFNQILAELKSNLVIHG